MIMGHYTILEGMDFQIIKCGNKELVCLPYTFYESNGYLLLNFDNLISKCSLSWHEILGTEEYEVIECVDKKLQECADMIDNKKYKAVIKDIVAFKLKPVNASLDELVDLLTNSRFYELRYADIPTMFLDSFVPIAVKDDHVLAIGLGTTSFKAADERNILDGVSQSDISQLLEVFVIPFKKSEIALNVNI